MYTTVSNGPEYFQTTTNSDITFGECITTDTNQLIKIIMGGQIIKRYCHECGSKATMGDEFCPFCGELL